MRGDGLLWCNSSFSPTKPCGFWFVPSNLCVELRDVPALFVRYNCCSFAWEAETWRWYQIAFLCSTCTSFLWRHSSDPSARRSLVSSKWRKASIFGRVKTLCLGIQTGQKEKPGTDLVLYAVFSTLISDLVCAECLDLLPFNPKHSIPLHKSLTVAICSRAGIHQGFSVIKHSWLEHVALPPRAARYNRMAASSRGY